MRNVISLKTEDKNVKSFPINSRKNVFSIAVHLREKYQQSSENLWFVFIKNPPDVFSVDETVPERLHLFPSKLNKNFEASGETFQSNFPLQIIFNHTSL